METHRTILCVDDDIDDRNLLCEMINKIDPQYDIVEAENGVQALMYLSKAKQQHRLPCLVVLDINMPLLNGKETLEKIQKDHELTGMPVVIFTASENPNDKASFARKGIEMVTKPHDYQNFHLMVQDFLKKCG